MRATTLAILIIWLRSTSTLATDTTHTTTTTKDDPPYRVGYTAATPSHIPIPRRTDNLLSFKDLKDLNYHYHDPVGSRLIRVIAPPSPVSVPSFSLSKRNVYRPRPVRQPINITLPLPNSNTNATSQVINSTTIPTSTSVSKLATAPVILSTTSSTVTRCLNSSATDITINSLFQAGGIGTTVYLCENAVINITSYLHFWYPNQTLATLNYPTGTTRAIIRIVRGTQLPQGTEQTCAIYAFTGTDYSSLRNVQIDGARETLGIGNEPFALVEMGGNNHGHVVNQCHLYEPRGWSALHGGEGGWGGTPATPLCRGLSITNNQVGPAGHSPTGSSQFRKRDTTVYQAGVWADGISMACFNGTVSGNTVTDATDGSIVIFSSEGTVVSGNTIISATRVAMGGINMVDYYPFMGSFARTVVKNNLFYTSTGMTKVGIAIGQNIWGTESLHPSQYLHGKAQVVNNVFRSGTTGYFGYAIAIATTADFIVTGNTAPGAKFKGIIASPCFKGMPNPQAFVYATTTTNTTVVKQSSFVPYPVVELLICIAPVTA